MGCSTSKEEIIQLKSALNKLRDSNRTLSLKDSEVAYTLDEVSSIIGEIHAENDDSLKNIHALLGEEYKPLPHVSINLDNLKTYFYAQLSETRSLK